MWHVGPAGVARMSTASASQSISIDSTDSVFPLVSPLRQRVPREREWKWTSPVRNVASTASASCQPTMRTRPSAASWTTAATRPSAP